MRHCNKTYALVFKAVTFKSLTKKGAWVKKKRMMKRFTFLFLLCISSIETRGKGGGGRGRGGGGVVMVRDGS